MIPVLAPRDIVLVERQDRDVRQPGHIMLVMGHESAGMIKRVAVNEQEGDKDWRIMHYSDNAASHPPMMFSLKNDVPDDWDRAFVGRVVRAWSDISGKKAAGCFFINYPPRSATHRPPHSNLAPTTALSHFRVRKLRVYPAIRTVLPLRFVPTSSPTFEPAPRLCP